jgi:hypothetical protein
VKDCASDLSTAQTPSATCRSFLNNNEKANLQWMLESQLFTFESQPWPTDNRLSHYNGLPGEVWVLPGLNPRNIP